jgi:hypothetical protein
MATPPSPGGVAMAAIVSLLYMKIAEHLSNLAFEDNKRADGLKPQRKSATSPTRIITAATRSSESENHRRGTEYTEFG